MRIIEIVMDRVLNHQANAFLEEKTKKYIT